MNKQSIEIRRSEPEDYLAIQRVHSQPKAISGTLQLPLPSASMWRKRLTEQPDNLYGLVACVNDELVGSLGLRVLTDTPRRRHVGTVGMAVHDKWHRRGIGSALLDAAIDLADRWFNLLRLELTVYTDNVPAIRLYEKFGFEIEGTLRKYSFRDGEFADAYSMARVR